MFYMIQIFKNTLKEYNIKSWRFTVIYVLLAVIAAVSNIVGIRATGDMTQAATQAADPGITNDMVIFLIILAVAGIVQTLFGGILALIEKRAFSSVIHKIRQVFASRLLHMPYKEFSGKNSGEGASLFTIDVPQTASFLTVQALAQIIQLTTLLVSVVFMLLINWWLTLGYFILFPILAIM